MASQRLRLLAPNTREVYNRGPRRNALYAALATFPLYTHSPSKTRVTIPSYVQVSSSDTGGELEFTRVRYEVLVRQQADLVIAVAYFVCNPDPTPTATGATKTYHHPIYEPVKTTSTVPFPTAPSLPHPPLHNHTYPSSALSLFSGHA